MAVGGVAEVCTDFAPFVAAKVRAVRIQDRRVVSHESPSFVSDPARWGRRVPGPIPETCLS
jgi:hypothetical protein